MNHYYYVDCFEGQIIPEYIGSQSANQFDLSNTGAYLVIKLNSPTNAEIDQIKSGVFEMGITCFPEVLWMTFKFGGLPWGEAPYTPHLSKQADLINNLYPACSDLTILLVDTTDGKVVHVRRVAFSEAISAALRTGTSLLLGEDFDKAQYDAICQLVQSKFNVQKISSIAVVTFSTDSESKN